MLELIVIEGFCRRKLHSTAMAGLVEEPPKDLLVS